MKKKQIKKRKKSTKRAKNKSFTFIDLFAGIGGFRIAFEKADGKCVFSSEIDEKCQDMYENHFGDRPYGDITKINTDEIPNHDILTGGFPCQPFSIIGNGKGFTDTRGTLFFDIERILIAKKPQAFLLENVSRLVSHDNGRTFKTILTKLENLGYFIHYKVLNGIDFGVPQTRKRILIVGFLKNYPFIFPDGKRLKKKTLEDILEDNEDVDACHFLSNDMEKKLEKKLLQQKKVRPNYRSIWHENKSGNIGIHPFSCALRAGSSYNYLLVDGVRRPTPREMFRLQGFPENYKIIVPHTQARKQAGNAVVIPKIQSVAKAMVIAMNQKPITSNKTPYHDKH